MQYLAKSADGTVAVITLFPTKLIRNSDGVEFVIVGQRREEGKNGAPGSCILYGTVAGPGHPVEQGRPWRMTIGTDTYDIARLEPDTLPGHTFVFPDIQRDVIGKWVPQQRAAVAGVRRSHRDDIPADRTYRNAWTDAGTGITVDMPKARELHRHYMRVARKPKLQELDIQYTRADERGLSPDVDSEKQGITARKQELRDVTDSPAIEAATTPEELRACWPACLGAFPRIQAPVD